MNNIKENKTKETKSEVSGERNTLSKIEKSRKSLTLKSISISLLTLLLLLLSGCCSSSSTLQPEPQIVYKTRIIEKPIPVFCDISICYPKPINISYSQHSYENKAKALKMYIRQMELYNNCLEAQIKLCTENNKRTEIESKTK